jgi:hypothetical protein
MTGVTANCVSKHLHINDADEKRKRVEVLVKITLGNGNLLGTLASKGIKVISKPSKKRQSVKNIERMLVFFLLFSVTHSLFSLYTSWYYSFFI